MLVSKNTPLNLVSIWSPRYKDRTVLIATHKVKEHNKIIFVRAKHLADHQYYMTGKKIRSYPLDDNGKVSCYAVPLDDLEPLEYKEDVAKTALSLFDDEPQQNASVELDPKKHPQRTNQQNKALHVLFQLLANNLNEAGLDMRKTLKPGVEIPWSGNGIKEYLWRPIQKAQLNKDSTTELTTKEIDEVFDTLNKYLGEKFGLHTPFPSVEEIILQQEAAREEKKRARKSKKSD